MHAVPIFKNKTFIVTFVVFLLSCFACYHFIYKANIEKSKDLTLKIEEAKKIKVLMDQAKELEAKIDAYMSMRNDNPEPSSFLSKVVEVANTCDIKVDSINAGGIISDGPYKFLPCGISFTTSYPKLTAFINKLESDKKYMRVENLSLNPVKASSKTESNMQQKGKESILMNVSMDIVGFYCN